MKHSQPSRFALFLVFAAIITLTATAFSQTESVIYTFVPNTGAFPEGLLFDPSGNLYVTAEGGDQSSGHGSVLELSPVSGGWTTSEIENFPQLADGWTPFAGLVSDASGNLYGTTLMGGTASTTCSEGCGTVFELSPVAGGGWTETVLHAFTAGKDGNQPVGIILDAAGNIYGVTLAGGAHSWGTVFELSPSSTGWTETLLHNFTGGADGGLPAASLVFDASGNLYGTTQEGGNINCGNPEGCGVAFELSQSGGVWKETVMHTFQGGKDGANPISTPVFDASGNLYGTTWAAGDLSACHGAGCGTVFQLSHNSQGWKINIIRSFGGGKDGANPIAGLVFDASGNLYGTTQKGGTTGCAGNNGCGTVFKLSPTTGIWNETLLHAFTSHPDGANPNSSLIFDKSGNLYGTTEAGGGGYGTIFEITP